MGKPLDALTPEQKAELGNLASRQSQVGKGLQNLQERMGEMARPDRRVGPAGIGGDARGGREESSSRGRPASSVRPPISSKRTRWARPSRQEQAREEIRDLVDAIQNRRERELARLVKELKNAESELAKTRARQAQNLKKTREAQRNPNAKERKEQLKRLAKEQAEIRKDLERQLQRLAKLSADRAARAGQSASGRMEPGQGNLDEDDGERPARNRRRPSPIWKTRRTSSSRRAAKPRSNWPWNSLPGWATGSSRSPSGRKRSSPRPTSYEALRQKSDGRLTIAQRAGSRGWVRFKPASRRRRPS